MYAPSLTVFLLRCVSLSNAYSDFHVCMNVWVRVYVCWRNAQTTCRTLLSALSLLSLPLNSEEGKFQKEISELLETGNVSPRQDTRASEPLDIYPLLLIEQLKRKFWIRRPRLRRRRRSG